MNGKEPVNEVERGLVTSSGQESVKAIEQEPVTAAQMKEIERRADEAGLSYYQMMENAGSGAAEYICSREAVAGKRILILCGKGNNGGDGFVVARKLTEAGALAKVVLVEGEPKPEDAVKNWEICKGMKIPMVSLSSLPPGEGGSMPGGIAGLTGEAGDLFVEAELIVDGIYGTGFHGALREPARTVAREINLCKAVVYALDIPSGLNGDTGEADEDTVRADCTIVFHRLKPAHANEKCRGYCGRIACISIGIEDYLD